MCRVISSSLRSAIGYNPPDLGPYWLRKSYAHLMSDNLTWSEHNVATHVE